MASDSSATQSPMRITSSYFVFEIDYSKSKDLPSGECIFSPKFTAGGYDWVLEFYPQGTKPEYQQSISLYLSLRSQVEDIIAKYSFKLLSKTKNFCTVAGDLEHTFSGYDDAFGYVKFIPRHNLESLYYVNDIIAVVCKIKVITEPRGVETCPSGLYEHIMKFREKGDRFDVKFEVEGESFPAHKFMLAVRSLVFEAELFGSMAETKLEHIKIDNVKAKVFKVVLHFLYTDQLAMDEFRDHETVSVEFLQDLLVVADRYAFEKLTFLCEEQLVNNLSVDTVVATLLLADRHSDVGQPESDSDSGSDPEDI